MNIVLYGATGHIGSRILKELLSRGYIVTSIVRDPKKLAPAPHLTIMQGDLEDMDKIAAAIRGANAVVSAYGPPPDKTDEIIEVTKRLIAAVKKAGVPRVIVVGGAGGLNVAPGVTLIDSGHVPPEWLPIAKSHFAAYNLLKASHIDWTYFAPAAFIVPGERTGKFRLGTDTLLTDEKDESRISMEDYAMALVDELEQPAHWKRRFTIAY